MYPNSSRLTPRDAGERTRTSKSREAQRDLNPSRLPVPPHPRENQNRPIFGRYTGAGNARIRLARNAQRAERP
jgi:hypothetical protein